MTKIIEILRCEIKISVCFLKQFFNLPDIAFRIIINYVHPPKNMPENKTPPDSFCFISVK